MTQTNLPMPTASGGRKPPEKRPYPTANPQDPARDAVPRGAYAPRSPSLACAALVVLLAASARGQDEISGDPKSSGPFASKKGVQYIDGSINGSDPTEKERPGHHYKWHVVRLRSGKQYTLDVRATGTDKFAPTLRVEDTSGKKIETDNALGFPVFTAPANGDYRIVVASLDPSTYGGYRIALAEVPPGTPAHGIVSAFQMPETYVFGEIVVTVVGRTTDDNRVESFHGYAEYRFDVKNGSAKQPHVVTLQLPSTTSSRGGYYENSLRSIKKTVELAPGTTVQISIFQPYLPVGGGHVSVTIDGRLQDNGFTINLRRGEWDSRRTYRGSSGKAASLLVSPDLTVTLWTLLPRLQATIEEREQRLYPSSLVYPATSPPSVPEVLPAPEPASPPPTPPKMTPPALPYDPFDEKFRDPLRVTDLLYSEPSTAKATDFETTTADRQILTTRSWLAFGTYDGIFLSGRAFDALPAETRSALCHAIECGGTLVIAGKCRLPEGWTFQATRGKHRFASPGFGKCLVFDDANVDKWSNKDVQAISHNVRQSSAAFDHIRTVTDANREFPVIESIKIPVRGLFAFMIVFVLIIGPLNLFWLSRIKRRMWLLWTVPVISLVTTGLLFGFVGVTEGWHPHFRGMGVTYLDENSQRASTVGWLGYYSPTSSAGLHFAVDTELSPHLQAAGHSYRGHHDRGHYATYDIDWSTDQYLEPGWITSKVPLHFLVRRSEKGLERLPVRRDGNDLIVVNGLKAPIKSLRFADKSGVVYTGTDIGAGAEARLVRSNETASRRNRLHDLYALSWLHFERYVNDGTLTLQPGTYVATLDALPFLDDGLAKAQSRTSASVVLGVSKEAP